MTVTIAAEHLFVAPNLAAGDHEGRPCLHLDVIGAAGDHEGRPYWRLDVIWAAGDHEGRPYLRLDVI